MFHLFPIYFLVSSCFIFHTAEAATGGDLQKKVLLRISQNLQENTCTRVSFLNKVAGACNFIEQETLAQSFNFIEKEILAQVFSRELCKIFKNTFFTEHLLATASHTSQKRR